MNNTEIDNLVIVFSSHNRGTIAIVKSLLDNYGIEYFTMNETVNNAFGSGILGPDPVMPPVEILVPESDKDEAINILKDVQNK